VISLTFADGLAVVSDEFKPVRSRKKKSFKAKIFYFDEAVSEDFLSCRGSHGNKTIFALFVVFNLQQQLVLVDAKLRAFRTASLTSAVKKELNLVRRNNMVGEQLNIAT
jgi:hypothetical protein